MTASTPDLPLPIERFCGVDDPREYLNAPWRRDGKLYATNGHFMIEIADDGREAPEFKNHPDCAKIFAKHTPSEFGSIPALVEAVPCQCCKGRGMCYSEPCPDCNGRGEFRHGSFDYECQRCDGDGEFIFPVPPIGMAETRCAACYGLGEEFNKDHGTKVGEFKFATRLLRVLTTLPGIEIATCGPEAPLWFRFDGGRGLVMPMRI